jgi:uncharacterized protein (UPF0332 family)
MNMDPREFLNLAKRLVGSEQNPEGLRSAISRAYYAAFNVAAEFLDSIGCKIPEDAIGHKRAYFYLNNSGDQQLIVAAADLDNFRDIRNAADYHMDRKDVESKPIVDNWIDIANDFIAALDQCRAASQRFLNVSITVKAYKKQAGY